MNHRVHLLLRLLPLLDQLLKVLVHRVLAAEEGVDLMLLEGEAGLDGLLASPVFAVSLALDEDLDEGCT